MSVGLNHLGKRICIIGPSNSGKSTLAVSLAQKNGGVVCHLDQLAHKENTNWERRPEKDFLDDHDRVIQGDRWIIEGNYSLCMPQRLARATAVIWLDPPLLGCLWRYIKRSFQNDALRAGNLEGAQGQFSLGLVKYTFVNYPQNKKKYAEFTENCEKPVIKIHSFAELNKKYKDWGLVIAD